ncbi:MAG TPA: PIN domain-containing protein [Novosphingobium sp.]
MIFDTNVVIALLDRSGVPEIRDRIVELLASGKVYINEIVFAEVATHFSGADLALAHLTELGLTLSRLSLEDCHRAGTAFARYRRSGGLRTAILPDFLIGAQAAGQGWPIVTRDRKGFARYFPGVDLIDPYADPDRA